MERSQFQVPLLVSYAYFKDKLFAGDYRIIEEVRAGNIELMIDSGAFTAFTKGKEIRLNDYLSFIARLRAENIPFNYVQLDAIGDPEATFRNYEEMRRQGFGDTIPVFTRGENIEHLDHLYSMSDYIMLGGIAVGDTTKNYVKYILERNNNRRIHLLGFTVANFLRHYRPYSCDSSGSESYARFGGWPYYDPAFGVRTAKEVSDQKVFNYYRRERLLPWIRQAAASSVCNDKLFLGRYCYIHRAFDLRDRYDVKQYLALTTNIDYFWQACEAFKGGTR